MAIYDRDAHKIVVRVVYDGAARSGKTTNVQKICESFTTRRRGELFVPEESGGRTQYFDWLQLDSGLVGGIPLRCQLVTVPGQESLRHRRERLLASADVVVFVADSTVEGLVDSMRAYGELAGLVSSERVCPVIVQANKQDLADAVGVPRVQATLGLDNTIPVTPASAANGMGVRETLVLAIRAAADQVQRSLLEIGVDALEGVSESPEALYEAMRAAEALLRVPVPSPARHRDIRELLALKPDPDDILSIEEVEADDEAWELEEGRETTTATAATAPAPIDVATAGAEPAPEPAAVGEPAAEPEPAAVAEPVAAPEPASIAEPVAVLEPAAAAEPEPAAAAEPEQTLDEVDRPVTLARGTQVGPRPAFPDPMVPSGFIWPGTTGRVLLRELLEQKPVARDDLVGQHGASDGSGTSDAVIYEAGPWFLKTSGRRRFEDVDDAREALLKLARKKVALGDLLLPHTVLSLCPDDAGGVWLWTVAPHVTTLRARMVNAIADSNDIELATALADFAAAAVESLVMASVREVVLDVHPGNFANVNGDLVYIDDDIENGSSIPLIGHLLMQRVHEYEHRPRAVKQYVHSLSLRMRDRLSAVQVSALDLVSALEDAPARSSFARQARQELVTAAREAQGQP